MLSKTGGNLVAGLGSTLFFGAMAGLFGERWTLWGAAFGFVFWAGLLVWERYAARSD